MLVVETVARIRRLHLVQGKSIKAICRELGVSRKVVRKVLLTYWNTASFFTLYAEANGWNPATTPAPPRTDRPLLDRWALARLASVTGEVTDWTRLTPEALQAWRERLTGLLADERAEIIN